MPSETFDRLNKIKKNRILQAAQKEFTEKLFEEAKVVNICKNAEIPRVTFYSYFASLADIYGYLYKELLRQYIGDSLFDCQAGSYGSEWEKYNMKILESDQGLRMLYENLKSAPMEDRMFYHISMSLSLQYKLHVITRSEFLEEFTTIRNKLFEEK
jgi:AcrR family transcriptional regulator